MRNKGSEPVQYATEEAPLRPTDERIRRSDNYDDGKPTKDTPRVRPARLGTPWDRYCHPAGSGQAALERHQILAGNHYATDYDRCAYGRVPVCRYIPSVDGSTNGESIYVWAARDQIRKAQTLLRTHEIDLINFVLVSGGSAKQWAINAGLHYKGGLDRLREALDILAKHYGYTNRQSRARPLDQGPRD